MIYRVAQGRKGEDDRILARICPNNSCRHLETILIANVMKEIRFKILNEERGYPCTKGFKGGEMIKDFITEGMRQTTKVDFVFSIERLCKMFQLEAREGELLTCNDIPWKELGEYI